MLGLIMNIVCIGGGHGLSQVLNAIQGIDADITAIVTTTDNGGSTGRLRKDESLIAYGDIRRCVNTLAPNNLLLKILSDLRLTASNDLNGHCVGNILLTALNQITANPTEAIKLFSSLLGVEHTILPMTDSPVDLTASDSHGNIIEGECEVDAMDELPSTLGLSKEVSANPQAVEAINKADLILIGPGSLLTSILPPLLLKEIKQALKETKAPRVYIENLVSENSVVASLTPIQQINKAQQLVGFKFYDICLSAKAFNELDLSNSPVDTSKGTHDKAQLMSLIQQLAPSGHIQHAASLSIH